MSLADTWLLAWPQALAVWSKFTMLCDPILCTTRIQASAEGVSESFAAIRFTDKRVVIDLESVKKKKLDKYAVEILAHEAGHHVYCPANQTANYRMLAKIHKALPGLQQHISSIANMYCDLLINDRLKRQASLRMDQVFIALGKAGSTSSPVWILYMRIYEVLWKLDKGTLCDATLPPAMESDAWLGSRIIRVYAHDWLTGASRFAVLFARYLDQDEERESPGSFRIFLDLNNALSGCEPSGIVAIDKGDADILHPGEDPLLSGVYIPSVPVQMEEVNEAGTGQAREPWEYGEIIRASGSRLTDHEIAVKYYRERALPYLLPYPSVVHPRTADPVPEGLESWSLGDSFDELDYLQSVTSSPVMIPGVTTFKRMYGSQDGSESDVVPMDLDIYVDCSGSMANPQKNTSWLTLAGAIIALSALRSGSSVQVTLWSGKHDVMQTPGFTRSEKEILTVLTGYFGGMTCFPIHCLRETYLERTRERVTHILMISDDGISTMFDSDEKNNSGWDISAAALASAGGGGTFALNLPGGFLDSTKAHWGGDSSRVIKKAVQEQGWALYAISDWEDLMDFARQFAQRHRDGLIDSGTRSRV